MSRKQNQVIVDFIGIYRSEPCLWQVKSSEYHDRAKKDAAYNKLAKKLQEVEPDAEKKSVLAKINSLRSAFRKEKKKLESSKKSGASADSIYKPLLWYYDLFDFLHDEDTPRTSKSNLDSDNDEETTDNLLPLGEDVNEDEEASTSTYEDTPAKQTPKSRSGCYKKRKTNDDLSAEVLTSLRDHFKKPRNELGRFDLMGKSVAERLKGLEERVALIAERKINDILYEAEMGFQSSSTSESPTYITQSTTSSTEIPTSFTEIYNSGNGQAFYSHDTTASSFFSQYNDV